MNNRFLKPTELLLLKIKELYPNLPEENYNRILIEAVLGADKRLIKTDGNFSISAADLRFKLAWLLEKPSLEHMSLENAQSMRFTNGEVNPVDEYFDWLKKTTQVLKLLNDGYITKEDAELRENFLDELNFRENDLILCLGLYEKNNTTLAMERWRFVKYKLQKLREMRTSIKFLTHTEEETQTTRSEYDTAVPYYQYFKKLQQAEFGQDLSSEAKERYGIRIGHENDADLKDDYDHYSDIVDELLDKITMTAEAQK